MVRLNDVFLLHGAESFLNSASPYDSYLLIRTATLSSGAANIDLSEILQDASLCEYVILKQANVNSSGILAVSTTAIGASDTVSILIMTDASNIKDLGE